MNNLTTILWDAGGVIYSFNQEKCDEKLARDCGRTPKEVSELLFGVSGADRRYNAGLCEPFILGRIDERQFYHRVKEQLGLGMNYIDFIDAWNDIFTLNYDITGFIRRAADAGIPQGILSSTNSLHWQKMNSLFDLETVLGKETIVCTYHPGVGVKKGEPRLFDIALERLKMKKEETVYVDDVKKYVDAAQQYGFGAVVHVELQRRESFQEECIRELERLGFRA